MKKHLIVLFFIFSINLFSQDNFQKILNDINEAESKKLPQTAIELALKLEKEALKKKDHGMYVRALTKRILNECHARGKMPKDKLNILKEEMAKISKQDRPIMNLILANWYWHYFEQNRFKFSSRTKTSGLNEEDFTTWDIAKIYSETKIIYESVLKDSSFLKKTTIDIYQPILEPGNVFLDRSMTLYEFALQDYLNFLNSGSSMMPAPQDKFEIDLNSEALSESELFLKYKPITTDVDSFLLRSIQIYQDLLTFYRNSKLEDQYIDVDLQRLKYVKNQVQSEDAELKYVSELEGIEKKYPKNSLITLASFEIASLLLSKGKEVDAVEKCKKAITNFSESDGGKQCQNLVREIEKPAYSLKIENAINKNNSKIILNYKNLKKIYFRVLEENIVEKLNSKNPFENNIWGDEIKKTLAKKPLKEWSVELPTISNFKANEIEIDLPDLKYGLYKIIASSSNDFAFNNNSSKEQLAYSNFWKTDSMILVKGNKNKITGYVLDARNGKPLDAVNVHAYQYIWSNKTNSMLAEKLKTLKTNKEGMFEIESNENIYFYIESSTTGNIVYDQGAHRNYQSNKLPLNSQALIFTDRAIYRPGQNVQFKVICYQHDEQNDKYNIYQCKNTTVHFIDNNGQEVDEKTFNANEYGSFSGSFQIPKNLLLGNMTLISDNPKSFGVIRVEEYKRPKFEVTLQKPDQQFRLNESISINGKALTYSGAPLQSAKVKYRVVRGVKLPSWWHWDNPYRAEQEIANGTINTNSTGEFEIKFIAEANANVNPKVKPTFEYRILVDVTDIGGETRSATILTNVGFVALNAELKVDEWVLGGGKSKINIMINNLDNMPQNVTGELQIYRLKNPVTVARRSSIENNYWYRYYLNNDSSKNNFKDYSDFNNWDIDNEVRKSSFNTLNGNAEAEFQLEHGAYAAIIKFKDQFGNSIEERKNFIVIPKENQDFSVKVPVFNLVKQDSLSVGEMLEVYWATGYDSGPMHFEVTQNGNVLQSIWLDKSQMNFKMPITEKLKGGFSIQGFFVKENQLYQFTKLINVKRTELDLKLSKVKFKNKLRPGEKDSWSFKILNHNNDKFNGEMAATLFDESLETFANHTIPKFSGYWHELPTQEFASALRMNNFEIIYTWYIPYVSVSRLYPTFQNDIKYQFSYLWPYYPVYRKGMDYMKSMPAASMAMDNAASELDMSASKKGLSAIANFKSIENKESVKQSIENKPEVKIRKNLNETAFYYPQLISDKDGNVSFEFTMPEALTKWKFMALVHGKNTEWGSISDSITTEQELMLTPNVPRFLRQGDKVYITAKVDNLSNKNINGKLRLKIKNADSEIDVSNLFMKVNQIQSMSLMPKSSMVYYFELIVPDVNYPILYTLTAESEEFSDGEEGLIPILSKNILVKESLPLWINDIGSKEFKFDKLLNSNKSNSLLNEKLVVQMVSNPAWYAVMAIPYMEKDYPECTDYVFERFFANSLGENIINLNPKIEKIFKKWKQTDSLNSPLSKNSDLKSVNLDDTPWVLDAKNETESKNNVAKFFDKNNLKLSLKESFEELKNRMNPDGGWSWVPGGPVDHFTTLYIVVGFGKLKSLNVVSDLSLAYESINFLDKWIFDMYKQIPENEKKENHFSHIIAYYLYGRSFYLSELPIKSEFKVAVDYYVNQAEKFWTKLDSRMSEANTAIALRRFGKQDTTDLIIKSLKERAIHNDEMGMYWGDEEWAYWWYRAPIETQARIIELFSFDSINKKDVEEMKVWLIKQKQTTDWKTSKGTAEVVYTFLTSGTNLLADNKEVEVEMGSNKIIPKDVEAGTGFFEKRFTVNEIKNEMGKIKISKKEKGVSYGGVYWHYFEDVSKITAHKTPLSLTKTLWLKRDTKSGPTLYPIKGQKLAVGDVLVVRIVLKTDRDMEYVMLKDFRGSGTEPLSTNSVWKYQDGLSYYESIRDTSTNFFLSYLPKGTYVFEYDLRLFQKGEFQSGLAEIQSLYAPEFSSHSESMKIVVD